MYKLPKDPVMLMSVINMKLRDFYPDLEALCDDMDLDIEKLKEKLRENGFEYDENSRRFI